MKPKTITSIAKIQTVSLLIRSLHNIVDPVVDVYGLWILFMNIDNHEVNRSGPRYIKEYMEKTVADET